MTGLRFAELQSRPGEFLDFTSVSLTSFSSWPHPSRPRSTPGWRRGGRMGDHGPLAGLPWTKPAPANPRGSVIVYSNVYLLYLST